MLRTTILLVSLLAVPAVTRAPNTPIPNVPMREFRAAWITPVAGFDWPSPEQSAKQQQAELSRLLDQAKRLHLNAVILHVRMSADALYPTRRAPWSAHLTGHQGVSPHYDPLAFAIKEAHARGLQLHAWFNPFRATATPLRTRLSKTHVTRTHPGWIVRYGGETWINPGIPAARRAVLRDIMEVVENYDIDGVHLDDYFYPYREDGAGDFNDPLTWRKYGIKAGFKNKADWRRHNINTFVEQLYRSVHDAKPWLPVGISPFGIWKSGVPAGVTGLDAYSEIYADARLWLRNGWVDYLAPQLYWPTNGNQDRFYKLLSWWSSENPRGRFVWPGLAAFLAHRPSWPSEDIDRQVAAVRGAQPGRAGEIFFHFTSLSAEAPHYHDVAIMPRMTWLSKAKPAPLVIQRRHVVGDSLELQLQPLKPQVRWLLVQTRSGDDWDNEIRFHATKLRVARGRQVLLTPLSRTGALGEATAVTP